ncbi:hypothetical protein GGF43_001936 [Coemansia sp. RSA 2618]|nr:hypothetical protein GGF43_001936 [Coemansia sp. RSA 2618]
MFIYCDVGHDDALAIILAAYNPCIRLLGISSVSGNSSVKNTTENTLRVLKAAGVEGVKVYKGASKPLVKKVFHADKYHGPSGIGGVKHMPEADYEKYFDGSCNAVNAMYRAIMESDEPISIAAIGPLTNIALLLSVYPEAASKIKTLSIMGGAIGMGNTTAAAEFNIFCDPEAAHVVLNSKLEHVVFVPLDVTSTVLATEAVIKRISNAVCNPRFAELVTGLLWFYGNTHDDIFGTKDGMALHDPVAVAYLFMRDSFTEKRIRVDVECSQGSGSGRTFCDFFKHTELPENCWVATSVDSNRFWDNMIDALVIASERCCLAP